MSKNAKSRRETLKLSGGLLTTSLAVGVFSQGVAATDYDYELVVEKRNSGGVFEGNFPVTDWSTENVEPYAGDTITHDSSSGVLFVKLGVTNDFYSPGKDIIRWNGPGLDDFYVESMDRDIDVSVNGTLVPHGYEYPFR